MPTLAPAPPAKIARTSPPQVWQRRGFVWGAVIIASRLPEIIAYELGFNMQLWPSPLFQTMILIGLAIIAAWLCRIRNVTGFILATAAVTFGWRVVVPWIEASNVFQSLSSPLNWGGRFFLLRAIRIVGAVLMTLTLVGSGIGRQELFLRVGNWEAPVQPEPFFPFNRPMPWKRCALILFLIFGVVLPIYLYLNLHPHFDRLSMFWFMLPWAIASSALNAANEEFQFRSVILARLRDVVPLKEAFLVSAVFFGVSHYFGQPSGWAGVFMAGIAGWIWAKSMVETRGFTCAFAIHFVQDLVIFAFLAMSVGAKV